MNPLISVDTLSQMWDHESVIILDASPASNKSGLIPVSPDKRIKGSRKFDLKKVFSDGHSKFPNMLPTEANFQAAARALGINQESTLVVYDNLGIYSAPRVRWMFKAMGFDQVSVLDGGMAAWIDAGLPLEDQKDNMDYQEGNFVARFQPQLVKSIDQVEENIEQNEFILLDARSVGRFNGTAPEPRKELPSGSISGSLSLPFKSVLEDGRMKSKQALTEIFQGLNLDKKTLVFSCGSGLTACIILLAAELVLDYEMAVYDGSWTEWAMCKLI